MGFWLIPSAILLAAAIAWPDFFLVLLGPHYEHLRNMVPMLMTIACLNLLGGSLYTIVLASGRPGGLSLGIPIGIAAQAAYLALVGVSSVAEALGLALVLASVDVVTRLGVFLRTARSLRRQGDRRETS